MKANVIVTPSDQLGRAALAAQAVLTLVEENRSAGAELPSADQLGALTALVSESLGSAAQAAREEIAHLQVKYVAASVEVRA